MKKKLILILSTFLGFWLLFANKVELHKKAKNCEQIDNLQIFKKILNNGLTVLVKPTNNLDVVIDLWYNVGSKDEETNEKGLAHLLEHTCFNGTKQMLSEIDINSVCNKLSGHSNAMTSYDYTHYFFTLPERHWKEALPILADCMCNCSLNQDILNSEFKAVIQELKMNRDNYERTLLQEMTSTIFSDHPYHYPVIGFKQDIWNITPEKLSNFYKKHYIPNNATLVIVGNVKPDEAFELTEQYFGKIQPDFSYKKKEFYFNKDLSSKSVTLYRDIQSPKVVLGYLIPGLKNLNSNALDILAFLFDSRTSKLNLKLQEDLKLIHKLEISIWSFFDHGIFFIMFDPKNINDIDKIITIINEEINNIIKNGIDIKELKKVINTFKMSYYDSMSENYDQSNMIGRSHMATKDENLIFSFSEVDVEKAKKEIPEILSKYFRPSVMHKGFLLPIAPEEKQNWLNIQEESDKEDLLALNKRVRTTDIESCKYANKISSKPICSYNFAEPQIFNMKNGMKVLHYQNGNVPLIELRISLKSNSNYDPENLQGLYNFMTKVLHQSTKSHSYRDINEELENLGTSIRISPGYITLKTFSNELEKSLYILNEILTQPKFDDDEIEKVRDEILNEIKNNSDDQNDVANELILTNLYKNHPYSKKLIGTEESVKKITKTDLIDIYKKYISPKGATLAIVGDTSNDDAQSILEKTLGNWDGPEISELNYPKLEPIEYKEIKQYMNRDQVYLCYAGLSVDRNHQDFKKLRIFDEIFYGKGGGGKLFDLRQKTGLFYSIDGGLTCSPSKQPGFCMIKAIASLDKLNESENVIENCIDTIADSITEEELKQAKESVISLFANCYKNNSSIAATLLDLNEYNKPFDIYNKKAIEDYQKITLDEVRIAVKKILNIKSLIKIKVGRVKN